LPKKGVETVVYGGRKSTSQGECWVSRKKRVQQGTAAMESSWPGKSGLFQGFQHLETSQTPRGSGVGISSNKGIRKRVVSPI